MADPSDVGAFLGAQNAQALLAPVPKSETYAMMFLGLGLVGWPLHRKSLRTAVRHFS